MRPLDSRNFGATLYDLRQERKLTQAELAQTAKLTSSYYSELENSRRFPPTTVVIERLAIALKLSKLELNDLQAKAKRERSKMVRVSKDMPGELAELIRELSQVGDELTSEQIMQIRAAMKKRRTYVEKQRTFNKENSPSFRIKEN